MVLKDGGEIDERTNLSKVILPRADFGGRTSEGRNTGGRVTRPDPLDANIKPADRTPIEGVEPEVENYVEEEYVEEDYTEVRTTET